jgi:hypothetical protein
MQMTRRNFIKTGAIGLAAAKIATAASAAEIEKTSPGEVQTGGSPDKDAIRQFQVKFRKRNLSNCAGA